MHGTKREGQARYLGGRAPVRYGAEEGGGQRDDTGGGTDGRYRRGEQRDDTRRGRTRTRQT
eukprot:scaffold16154_cov122-Isochrysis_galbana.AAC.5